MKYLILLLMLTSCAQIDVSMYAGKDFHPDNKQLIGILEVEGYLTEEISCKYQHRSDITRGKPFNDWGETYSHDIGVCGYTKTIWMR